ncbi:hypothetical protein AGDE_15926 [Angomonas deanei]|uniref:TatD related DNase, putative n=1 Tax=Angomonas deanei TaxID=59799 RepID=A0A7G2CS81_9TRYP|nr:hypothetical protein AGDE_15926 [Angomonas deanei]CAD2222678.1 TatD related DNase, putative [Angomonas deanei]|eukprot:EPY18129.1 hypothetical protein AGDE_15926 [Angomonas deanei]
MGFVDRGGGRESKKSSLRKSVKNPGAAATRQKQANTNKSLIHPPTVQVPSLPPAVSALVEEVLLYQASHKEAKQKQNENENWMVSFAEAVREHCFSDRPQHNLWIDAAVALLARQFSGDTVSVLDRAGQNQENDLYSLSSLVLWCSEYERQITLLEECRSHNTLQDTILLSVEKSKSKHKTKKVKFAEEGEEEEKEKEHSPEDEVHPLFLYCVLGIHSNNIDRNFNKNIHATQWVEEIRTYSHGKEVLGILASLNFYSRDEKLMYSQELLFRALFKLAAELRKPLMIHLYVSESAAQHDVQKNNNNKE